MRGFRVLSAAQRASLPGKRALFPVRTGPLAPQVIPPPTPRRIGVVAAWEDRAAAARWTAELGRRFAGARGHWQFAGDIARAKFSEPMEGWTPDDTGARRLGDDEPALVLISGDLRPSRAKDFLTYNVGAVAGAEANPGYLGGLGLQKSWLNTTSCSAWRSYADIRAFAHKPGGHMAAVKNDRANGNHRQDWFLWLRPLESSGELNGRPEPFAGLL